MRPHLFRKITVFFVAAVLVIPLFPLAPAQAIHNGEGAAVFISPQSENVTVGETFQASIFIDTNEHTINTVDIKIKFPADKLQVVSPSVGKSIIGIWTTPPSFDNTTGELHFRGGIPSPGINTSKGLISTITFRARSVGTANISFIDSPKILLNDGLGTNILTETRGASNKLTLPLPQGPDVTSPTHPDQNKWYKGKTPTIKWTTEYGSVQGYSYILSDAPIDEPDDISESTETQISYKNLPDGLYYFHIKALRNGSWGGTTHFAIKIDSTPPAKFNIDILPKARTTSRFPIINFETTDALSGISHYELKIIPLNKGAETASQKSEDGFFIEAKTRYIAEVELGNYDVIVRAYDNTGNIRESARNMKITIPFITASAEGLWILNKFIIPWWIIILLALLLLALLSYLSYIAFRLHRRAHMDRAEGALNDPVIKRRLEELQKHKKKYEGMQHKVAAFILIASMSILMLPWTKSVNAQQVVPLPPPIITTVPLSISNDQLFYVGGQADVVDSEVILFLQNVQDGQVISQTVTVDQKGDWFYAYPEPLLSGSYLLWSQGRVGAQFSPPSPQKQISVSQTAFQIGASRLSFETLYLFITIILFGAILALGSYTSYHIFNGRRKKRELMKEIEEAEDVIKDGFETLHEDISSELDIIHKAKLSKALSAQEEDRESRLLKDLADIEKFIKKEFRDVKLKSRRI